MPVPFQRGDDYDSDPEVQAEKEMAKKDPVGFAIDANSLTSQKKAAVAKEEVSKTPPNLVIAGNGAAGSIANVTRSKSQDDVAKKQKAANQSKALKKQRSRGISGCSSRKYSGFDDDADDYDFDDEDDHEECFDEDEEDTYIQKK
uniref:HUN domain-containing protein n=1 Tax=Caenorhabditis tropicalis TaxID=1561998 RepID=A0A1I7V1W6_9PELO